MSKLLTELKIKAIRVETADTKSFVLEGVEGNVWSYKPGQFLTLVYPGKINEERRSYSISSDAAAGEPLTITVKRIDNGLFSRYLFDECRVGDALFTIGVSGFFTLPASVYDYQSVFFFGAGSGITPMLPMMRTLLREYPETLVHLVYSNHSRETTIFLNELSSLEKQYPETFKVTWMFSNSKNLALARVNKLFMTSFAGKLTVEEKLSSLFYVCGPKGYMQMVMITLLTEGIPAHAIRKEVFDTAKMAVKDLPPDQDEHKVIIHHSGDVHVFNVKYPDTILSAAKSAGLALPYSCEAGKCGTCAASCQRGRVWMSYNEVLTDRELQEGRVLTCTGYAVGGDVEIFY